MKKRLLVSCLFAGCFLLAVGHAVRGAESGSWLTDFEEATKVATEKSLPILVNFTGSDWCGWCKRLDAEVFSQKAFQDYAKENLVLFVADFPMRKKLSDATKAQNGQLNRKYGVKGYPTILLLDSQGKELARTGYKPGGAEAYVAHLKSLRGVTE
ncbi:MAG: thioredoxin family protein [Lentisphaeria bacterium]|nr:thioredoxin family protein [Lentisphaeria bacterium]